MSASCSSPESAWRGTAERPSERAANAASRETHVERPLEDARAIDGVRPNVLGKRRRRAPRGLHGWPENIVLAQQVLDLGTHRCDNVGTGQQAQLVKRIVEGRRADTVRQIARVCCQAFWRVLAKARIQQQHEQSEPVRHFVVGAELGGYIGHRAHLRRRTRGPEGRLQCTHMRHQSV